MCTYSRIFFDESRRDLVIHLQVWAAVTHPDHVLSARHAFVLQCDLLQCRERLIEALGPERTIHMFVRQAVRKVIECMKQVVAAVGVALQHVDGFIAYNEHFSR